MVSHSRLELYTEEKKFRKYRIYCVCVWVCGVCTQRNDDDILQAYSVRRVVLDTNCTVL